MTPIRALWSETVPVHRIRLRGPWDVRPHSGGEPGRMTVPGTLRDGGWTGFKGRVSFYRRFGRPSNLSAGETVWLVFENVVGSADVLLNDSLLGTLDGTGQLNVTERLAERNVLEVILETRNENGGITGDVLLEIRE
jgi:hypothetical protein